MGEPVSVVIPVRDGAAFIEEAIRSVRAQTALAAEILVVDDGSVDRTPDLVRQFPEVVYLRQKPLGQAAARNAGASAARMPLLAFLDADDLWPKDKLSRQIEALGAAGDLAAIFGHAIQFRDLDREGRPVPIGAPVPAHLPGAMLIRRETFWTVGAFASDWRVGEVIDWYARAVDRGISAITLPDVVLMRRIHEDNLGRRTKDAARDYLRVLRTTLARRNNR
jgi:glycosyltransferase involved in cell wall biosynthesis